MKTEEQKARERERMRVRRLDPAFKQREAELAKVRRKENPELHRRRVRVSRKKCMMDPEKYAHSVAITKANYRKLRTRLFALYGSACACCGETEPMFLEIDHVNGGGRKHYKARTPTGAYRDMIKSGKSADYQLLCSNCNRGRQRNGGTCPHRTAVKTLLMVV